MELKNIFKMTKADRYTQDGRDELAKLQETEDVKYKTGDISQKTGLQKQPDVSWAPPKGGAGKNVHGAEPDALNPTKKKEERIGQMQKETGKEAPYGRTLKGTPKTPDDNPLTERTQKRSESKPAAESKPKDTRKEMYELNRMDLTDLLLYAKEKDIHLFDPDIDKIRKTIFKTEQHRSGLEAKAESKPATSKPDTKEQTKALMEKYKDLPGAQKKDALYAATFEGSSIGMTQTSMERNGWDLIQADDDVNVYAKPDGSKVTMKHDGKRITSSEYEAPGSTENKPADAPATNAGNKTTIRQGPNTKTLNETPAEHIKKNWDYYAEPGRYGQEDMEQLVLSPSGYKETDSYGVMGGGKRVQYEKEGGEKIALFFNENGELDDYEIEKAESKSEEQSNPANSSWEDAKVSLKNQAGQGFFLNTIAFGMTPAWAKKNGYSPNDVNGSHAQNKLAEKIITSQDWSNPEDAVRKLNALNFGYNNWKVTEKQSDKVKIATKDRMGNLREITIAKPQSAADSAPRQLTGDCKIRIRK